MNQKREKESLLEKRVRLVLDFLLAFFFGGSAITLGPLAASRVPWFVTALVMVTVLIIALTHWVDEKKAATELLVAIAIFHLGIFLDQRGERFWALALSALTIAGLVFSPLSKPSPGWEFILDWKLRRWETYLLALSLQLGFVALLIFEVWASASLMAILGASSLILLWRNWLDEGLALFGLSIAQVWVVLSLAK